MMKKAAVEKPENTPHCPVAPAKSEPHRAGPPRRDPLKEGMLLAALDENNPTSTRPLTEQPAIG